MRQTYTQASVDLVHIASGDLWAGAEVVIYELMAAQSRRTDLRVCAALMNEGELAARLRMEGISVRIFDENQLSPLGITRELTRWLRSIGPQVTHTHRLKENVLGSIASRLASVPVSVRTQHGAPEHAIPWTQMDKRFARWLDVQSAMRLQQCTVAVSHGLAESLRGSQGPSRIEVIPNGIDVDRLRQSATQPFALDPARTHVGFIGRLVPVKRVDVFLEAAKILVDHSAGRYVFHVVGDGPLADSLAKRASELGLTPGNCVFHGFVPNPSRLMAALDCTVLTSDHEGLPMTALESLALGVPVVAHDVGGLGPLLSGIRQCRLVSSQDPAAFAGAIDEVTAVRPGRLAPSLLPDDYNIQATSDRYVRLYRRLLEEHSTRQR